jgi:hypothetical protein
MSAERPRTRRMRLARRAIDVAIVAAGFGVSVWLLSKPSLAMVAFWLALFVAATAFAIISGRRHDET